MLVSPLRDAGVSFHIVVEASAMMNVHCCSARIKCVAVCLTTKALHADSLSTRYSFVSRLNFCYDSHWSWCWATVCCLCKLLMQNRWCRIVAVHPTMSDFVCWRMLSDAVIFCVSWPETCKTLSGVPNGHAPASLAVKHLQQVPKSKAQQSTNHGSSSLHWHYDITAAWCYHTRPLNLLSAVMFLELPAAQKTNQVWGGAKMCETVNPA